MRHVLGPDAPQARVDTAAREAFRNVARYYVDLINIPRMDLRGMIGRQVRLQGLERLQAPMKEGRGAVAATAHFGNPELAVQVGAILGIDMLVLAEPLQPPAFADAMRRLRSPFGPRYVDVGYGAIAAAIRHLRSGGCLAITCDRDIQGNGEPVEFFGVETRVPTGAVELAARTGAALIPCYCRRAADRGFDIIFEEELPLVKTGNAKADALINARRLLDRAEAWIAADPGQWMPLERIWGTSVPANSA
jgi:KDO2-lipid IV(A) lauroyltransferase